MSAEEKRRLRREMLAGPIAHLADIGQLASRERHDLPNGFRFKPSADTYAAFRSAARSNAGGGTEPQGTAAQVRRVGVGDGVVRPAAGRVRRGHVAQQPGAGRAHGATSELKLLAAEIVQVVRAMDVRSRVRLKDDRQLLGAWINASTVFGLKRSVAGTPAVPGGGTDQGTPEGGTPAGGDVRPAAGTGGG